MFEVAAHQPAFKAPVRTLIISSCVKSEISFKLLKILCFLETGHGWTHQQD